MIPRLALAMAVALVIGGVRSAAGEIALDECGKLKLSGDLRFRFESDWSSTQPDGTERSARDRARLRARIGLKWMPTERTSFGFRLRTGHHDAQASTHVTLFQLQSGSVGDRDLLVDQAYLRIAGGGAWSWIGKNTSPFWRQRENLLDDDVPFQGIAGGYAKSPKGKRASRHSVIGAFLALPDGPANLDVHDRGTLAAVQYVHTRSTASRSGEWTVAGGMFAFRDDGEAPNPVLGDHDFTLWGASVQRKLTVAGRPLKVGLDLTWNSESYAASSWNRSERDGQVVSISLGQLEKKSDWQVACVFARVEKFAVVPFLAQDDWMRWGSGTQTRSSNYIGNELQLAFALGKSTNLQARIFHVKGIDLESPTAVAKEDGNRFRLDFNWSF